MSVVSLKRKKLKIILKNAYCFSKKSNVVQYRNLVKVVNNKEIWTDAFEKAINENDYIYIPKGLYFIDKTIVLTSNKKILANKNAKICLVFGTKTVMFRSKNVINGSYQKVGYENGIIENISIIGGMWGTEYKSRAKYGVVGAYDNEDSIHGVHALMLFNGVRNLSLENMKFFNTATFAIQIGRCENFIFQNLIFENAYADGVHINGEVRNGLIRNIKGDNEDDLVALNAYDWDNSTISNGFIENLVVSNIVSTGGECHCMRFLAGILPEEKGGIDCYLKNIYISKVNDVQTFKLYLQTPQYTDFPDGTRVGHIDDITFEDLIIEKKIPSDNSPYLYNKDLKCGHFGVFEIGSNISNITFKNIKIKTNMGLEYPDTYHMIIVGPKCFYIPTKKIEVFDPYIENTVKCISYKNIEINGEEINDLKKEIKEIKLDKIYETELPFGCGKVENITRI